MRRADFVSCPFKLSKFRSRDPWHSFAQLNTRLRARCGSCRVWRSLIWVTTNLFLCNLLWLDNVVKFASLHLCLPIFASDTKDLHVFFESPNRTSISQLVICSVAEVKPLIFPFLLGFIVRRRGWYVPVVHATYPINFFLQLHFLNFQHSLKYQSHARCVSVSWQVIMKKMWFVPMQVKKSEFELVSERFLRITVVLYLCESPESWIEEIFSLREGFWRR